MGRICTNRRIIACMADSVLTVGDLVATDSLDSALLAGDGGLGREVLWAHSCEMVDPAQWLGPHELLMTVGLCVPHSPADQVAFIARLDEAGLAGMMIGDHEIAPALSPDMLAEANRRGFPVVLVGERTPYAVIARHVAAANTTSQTLQVLKLSKLYHLAATVGDDPAEAVQSFASLLNVGIHVTDALSGLPIVGADPVGLAVEFPQSRVYPLKGSHPAQLELREFAGELMDSFVLVHLMKILEVTVDRLLNAADRRAEISAGLMKSLVNGGAIAEADAFLTPAMDDGFQVAAFSSSGAAAVQRATSVAQLQVIVGTGRHYALAVVPVPCLPAFREITMHVGSHVGLSSMFATLQDVRAAVWEAEHVRSSIEHGSTQWAEFEGTTLAVLSRSRREADEIIRNFLGPLAGDNPRVAGMRDTLFAFLRNDRRWQETADELGIHRQTLAYRLARIEKLTGLALAKTSDISALWVAYQAWESLHSNVAEGAGAAQL